MQAPGWGAALTKPQLFLGGHTPYTVDVFRRLLGTVIALHWSYSRYLVAKFEDLVQVGAVGVNHDGICVSINDLQVHLHTGGRREEG